MAAKDTQNIASNAKRAATTLRKIADMGVSLEDRGIMLAAARAVEAFAKDRTAVAKRQKEEELARDRFIAAQTPKAKALMLAEWSHATLLDQVAIIAAGPGLYTVDLIMKFARPNAKRAQLEIELADNLRRAIDSEAHYAAHQAWHKKLTLPQALAERTVNLNKMRADQRTAACAARFADFIARLDHKEAA